MQGEKKNQSAEEFISPMGYEHQRYLSCTAADTNYWKWKQALTMYESRAADTSKHIWDSGKLGVPATMSMQRMHIVTHT